MTRGPGFRTGLWECICSLVLTRSTDPMQWPLLLRSSSDCQPACGLGPGSPWTTLPLPQASGYRTVHPRPPPLWSVRCLAPQVTPHPLPPACRTSREAELLGEVVAFLAICPDGRGTHGGRGALLSLASEQGAEGPLWSVSPPQLFVTHPLPRDGRWGCAISTHLPQGPTRLQMVWAAAVHPAATC